MLFGAASHLYKRVSVRRSIGVRNMRQVQYIATSLYVIYSQAGDVARFVIRSNESPASIFYLLLGRGTILGSGQIKSRTSFGNTNNAAAEHLLQVRRM